MYYVWLIWLNHARFTITVVDSVALNAYHVIYSTFPEMCCGFHKQGRHELFENAFDCSVVLKSAYKYLKHINGELIQNTVWRLHSDPCIQKYTRNTTRIDFLMNGSMTPTILYFHWMHAVDPFEIPVNSYFRENKGQIYNITQHHIDICSVATGQHIATFVGGKDWSFSKHGAHHLYDVCLAWLWLKPILTISAWVISLPSDWPFGTFFCKYSVIGNAEHVTTFDAVLH